MPPGGIRTHILTRLAAADLRLRTSGHWNWQWDSQKVKVMFMVFMGKILTFTIEMFEN